MAEITAALVRELREKTGAGMMDCKRALTENAGDLEGAVDWLRKKGLATAAKKAGRVAAEGLVGAVVDGTVGAVVEVNAETDFVARNAEFQALVGDVANLALRTEGGVEALAAAKLGSGTVTDAITALVAKIGENMNLRRFARVTVSRGLVASYVHGAIAPGLGRIGVLVGLETEADPSKVAELGRMLAMHVAAANPSWRDVSEVDTSSLDRERAVLAEQARASGRPENIIEKMVEGRLRKFYEETVLLEQAWIHDPDKKVAKAIEEAAKAAGAAVTCTGFVRFALGEGVEKQASDFAAEVAAARGA